ncbi:hypothetical protein [Macrococcus animalis]|uniref:hypothetical protein n=1 Tax=Macrococcus animalis TaxID=3395467 RepID=UPI0039BDEC5D
MAYDVDFWYISQDACEITTDFVPFEKDVSVTEESIYMKTDDFFKMIEQYSTTCLHREMWKEFNDFLTQAGKNTQDSDSRFVIASIQDKAKELQEEYEMRGADFIKDIEKENEG